MAFVYNLLINCILRISLRKPICLQSQPKSESLQICLLSQLEFESLQIAYSNHWRLCLLTLLLSLDPWICQLIYGFSMSLLTTTTTIGNSAHFRMTILRVLSLKAQALLRVILSSLSNEWLFLTTYNSLHAHNKILKRRISRSRGRTLWWIPS